MTRLNRTHADDTTLRQKLERIELHVRSIRQFLDDLGADDPTVFAVDREQLEACFQDLLDAADRCDARLLGVISKQIGNDGREPY